jgi:hypothetical protein
VAETTPAPGERLGARSDAWSDLTLTLPIFLAYHLGVVFLPVQNAADVVTKKLVEMADNNLLEYGGLTLAIGVVFVGVLALLGRKQELRWQRFFWVLSEGIVYAIAMRFVAIYLVGKLRLGPVVAPVEADSLGTFAGVVLACGAGFYEEIAFRVLLFGLGGKVLRLFAEPITETRARLVGLGWAVAAAAGFSAWHYVGPLGEPFELRSFVFRWVCGLAFTLIYFARGFAPVVWTHVVYDVWVLVF